MLIFVIAVYESYCEVWDIYNRQESILQLYVFFNFVTLDFYFCVIEYDKKCIQWAFLS